MRAIDGDALEKYLSDAEIEAIKQRRYVFASALNTICGNVRNFPTIEPERKIGSPLIEKREWIEGYENRWYRKKFYCASCGIKIKIESWDKKRCFGEGTILQDNDMPNFCPNCGADLRGNQDENN